MDTLLELRDNALELVLDTVESCVENAPLWGLDTWDDPDTCLEKTPDAFGEGVAFAPPSPARNSSTRPRRSSPDDDDVTSSLDLRASRNSAAERCDRALDAGASSWFPQLVLCSSEASPGTENRRRTSAIGVVT